MKELKETIKQFFADGVDGVIFVPCDQEIEIDVLL